MHRTPPHHTVSHRAPDPVRHRHHLQRRRNVLGRAATGAVVLSVVAGLVDLGSAAAVPVAALPAVADTSVNADTPSTSSGAVHRLRLDAAPKAVSKPVAGATGPAPPTTPAPAPRATTPFVPYEAASFFRTPLPDNAPLDAQSALGISMAKLRNGSPYPKINGVGGNRWGMPFAMGTCSDPVWKLTGTVPAQAGFLRSEGFHAPAAFAATLTGTSDSPLVVVDRCGVPSMPRGLTVWASKASAGGPGVISVGSAGAFAHDSNGLDRRDPLSDSTKNFRSRGAIPDAMVIRDDLLSAAIATGGDLGHVLHMFWWETDSAAGAVHPMVGAESGKAGFGAEGMRLRIKSGVDLASRHCTPAGLAVARTLQHYGAYLGDNSGSGSGLKAEQGSTAITRDALSCVTWDDFAFVQRGWDPSAG